MNAYEFNTQFEKLDINNVTVSSVFPSTLTAPPTPKILSWIYFIIPLLFFEDLPDI